MSDTLVPGEGEQKIIPEIKKLKEVSRTIIYDILRYSIKKCNIAVPNRKIMDEILKTFIDSKPGPKSIVTWSRADREEDACLLYTSPSPRD